MDPVEVPEIVKQSRADHTYTKVGPPRGVSDEDCGTVEMAHGPFDPSIGGSPHRAYYKPTERELHRLIHGGYIEVTQWGRVVQPFACHIWGNGEEIPPFEEED